MINEKEIKINNQNLDITNSINTCLRCKELIVFKIIKKL